jgi:hypothetical protein
MVDVLSSNALNAQLRDADSNYKNLIGFAQIFVIPKWKKQASFVHEIIFEIKVYYRI